MFPLIIELLLFLHDIWKLHISVKLQTYLPSLEMLYTVEVKAVLRETIYQKFLEELPVLWALFIDL